MRPFVHGGRRVVVDGRPICAECGRGVWPTGPDRWRHVAPGERLPARSPWLSPTAAELSRCRTYEEFTATYPWAGNTTPDQWREAIERLERYAARLRAARARRTLRADENPYLDLVEVLAAEPPPTDDPFELAQPRIWGLPFGLAQLLDLPARRRELVQLFAWAIPTDEALEAVARHAPLVEGGAGMGYWAALLRAGGVDAVAYDLHPPGTGSTNDFHRGRRRPWTEVRQGSAVAAARAHRDRALVLCWPPYDDDAASWDALRAYRGETVVHIGERDGASGSVRFRRELELNWTLAEEVELPSWPRLEDRVLVYRRNDGPRLPLPRDRCTECRRFVAAGSYGRCDACFARRPPALALWSGRHRVEYAQEQLDAMPPALRLAFEASPQRIR